MTGKDDVLHLRCKNENTETYFMKNIDTCTVIDTGMLSISSLQDKNITYVIFLMRKKFTKVLTAVAFLKQIFSFFS